MPPEPTALTPEKFMERVEAMIKASGLEVGAAQGAAISAAVLTNLNEHLKTFGLTPRAADVATRTFGQVIAEDKELLNQLAVAKTTGKFGNMTIGRVAAPLWEFKVGDYQAGLGAVSYKDVTASQFPVPATVLPFARLPRRQFHIRDLVNVAGIGTPKVDYARITGFSNTAGPQVGEGALKPQVEISTTLVSDSERTMGAFMPVSRQAVSDVPGLRAWVDGTLEEFLLMKEDDELLNGIGGASDYTGLYNVALAAGRVQLQGGDSKLTAIRKAITQVQTGLGSGVNRLGFNPTGIILPPEQSEAIDLLTDTSGRYLLEPLDRTAAVQSVNTGRNIWGLAPVVTPAMNATRALVGAFDIAATYWIYEGLTIRVTDTHADYFRRNLLAFLGEWRGMLSTYFPNALCIVSFNP